MFKEVDGELKIVAIHQGRGREDHRHLSCGTLIREIHLEEEGWLHSYIAI